MKNQIFVTLFVAAIQLVASGCSHGGSEAYIPPVSGVIFTSSDEAWVLTRKGVLKRISIDGQTINISDAQQRVQGMSFISPTQVWTVDSDWNVWHFNGVNWAFVGHNGDNKFGLVWPSSVCFTDENVGWARTLESLFLTDDGGKTWQKVFVTEPGEFFNLYVIDRDAGYLYGPRGSVKRTSDRGQTWKSIDLGPAGDVTSFACRDEGRECWAGTARGELFSISKDSASRLPLTQTYREIAFLSISFNGASGIAFLAGYTYGQSGLGVLLRTDQGGDTWTKMEAPQDERFVQVANFGSTIWLASHAAIYRSLDGGGSWVKIYDTNN